MAVHTKPYAKGTILGVISAELKPYESGFVRIHVLVKDGKFKHYIPIVFMEGGLKMAEEFKEGDPVMVNYKVTMWKPKAAQYYQISLLGLSIKPGYIDFNPPDDEEEIGL